LKSVRLPALALLAECWRSTTAITAHLLGAPDRDCGCGALPLVAVDGASRTDRAGPSGFSIAANPHAACCTRAERPRRA
jgi:hypothetical protein